MDPKSKCMWYVDLGKNQTCDGLCFPDSRYCAAHAPHGNASTDTMPWVGGPEGRFVQPAPELVVDARHEEGVVR
jgi:hypothetical protein